MSSHALVDALIDMLIESTLAATAAVVLVLCLRQTVRRVFGASVAYALWWLVPIAMLSTWLPARVATAPQGGVMAAAMNAQPVILVIDTWHDMPMVVCVLWLAGCVATAGWFAWQQWRFVQGLGPLKRDADGVRRAAASTGLPAITGVFRPYLVLPADFESRYNAHEQHLVLQHEHIHLRRGDAQANAMAALLRCAYWFNPLLHLAANVFRRDQELACDASVIRRNPESRRSYGDAMLKTQLAGSALPLGCHWRGHHPLKERITMLKQPVPSRGRLFVGSMACLLLAIATGAAAWAAQPARVSAETPVAGVQTPAPKYPSAAYDEKQSGEVVLKILVARDGTAKQVEVLRSNPADVFDAAAIDAAKQWKFTPAVVDGKPSESWVQVPITFEWEPKEVPKQVPAPGGKSESNAYDWFRADNIAEGLRITCDTIYMDPETGIAYCGRLKQPAVG